MAPGGILRQRLAIWIFGPIGAGKTHVLSQLDLTHFRRVEQDTELEDRLRIERIPADTTRHTESQRTRFVELRKEVIRNLWEQVPRWRTEGENLCFETTGDKPLLFAAELAEGRRQGYRTLGCAIRCSLETCLAQNRARERVLDDGIVTASWQAFERFLGDGTYTKIFQGDRLEVCSSLDAALMAVREWMST